MNITGVRVATPYDLARLSSKDAKKYAASGSYGVETKEDFAEGCFYISHKDTKNNPVSGTILLIFTVGNASKQEFSLPLTVKALSLDSKNKWKVDNASVTLFQSTTTYANRKYVKVIYPVDCCAHELKCQLLGTDGREYLGGKVNAYVNAYDDTKIELSCAYDTPATSSNKPYTLVTTDAKNPDLPPLKVKVFVTENLPTISFEKNSATFVQEEIAIRGKFSTSVKISDKDFIFDNYQFELTEANSKLKVKSNLSLNNDEWKLYKGDNPDDFLYSVIYSKSDNKLTVLQNTKHGLFDNTKDEKYTLVLKYKGSNKCKASLKITSLSPTGAKGLTLKADKKSVKLNLNAGFAYGESCDRVKVKITPSSGSGDMFIHNIDIEKDIKIYTSSKYKDEAHRAPADAIKVISLDKDYYNSYYELTIAAGKECEAGKTYYLDCVSEFGSTESYGLETKPVTIAVNIMKDSVKPEVSLKASGYLDLNNIGSTVKITPVVKNVNSDVAMSAFQAHIIKYNGAKDKVGEEEYRGLIAYFNGKLTINKDSDEFKNGEIVPSGKNAIYKIYYTGYFGGTDPGDKNWEIKTKPVVITVKAGTAKIKQSTKSVTLYKNDRFDSAYVTLSLNDSNRYTDYEYVYGYREITSVVLDNSMYDVTLVNADTTNGKYTYAIGFKNNDLTTAQKAKAQTLKLKVYLKGTNESGTPSATVSVSVKVQ